MPAKLNAPEALPAVVKPTLLPETIVSCAAASGSLDRASRTTPFSVNVRAGLGADGAGASAAPQPTRKNTTSAMNGERIGALGSVDHVPKSNGHAQGDRVFTVDLQHATGQLVAGRTRSDVATMPRTEDGP